MIRRPPRSTLSSSSAASDVYKRQECHHPFSFQNRQRQLLQLFFYHYTYNTFILNLFFWFCKDHSSRRSLQNACYHNLDRLRYILSTLFNNNHSSVIQVSNCLIIFFSFFNQENLHVFTWENNWL